MLPSELDVLVIYKDPARAFSRLHRVMTAPQRQCLATTCLLATLEALWTLPLKINIHILTNAQSPVLPNGGDCIRIWQDVPERSLARNVTAVAQTLGEKTARPLMVLPIDLPYLSLSNLITFMTDARSDITIAQASSDGGTTALLTRKPSQTRFAYEVPQSARAHLDLAIHSGLSAHLVGGHALCTDIDTPADIDGLDLGGCSARMRAAWAPVLRAYHSMSHRPLAFNGAGNHAIM